MFLNPSFLLNLIYPLFFPENNPPLSWFCAIWDSQHFAEITAQIYGGICLFKQTPPYDFYCHPHFDSDNYFLFKI